MSVEQPKDEKAAAPALPNERPSDYLRDAATSAFFAAREHEAYYRSLKSVDQRRDFHERLKAALVRFLELADQAALPILDGIVARTKRYSAAIEADAVQRVLEPEDLRLLGLEDRFNFDQLKAAYRAAALRYHPDRGGTNVEMAAVNRAYEQAHAVLSEMDEMQADGGPSLIGEAETALDVLWLAVKLLFETTLDDWALDEALVWFEMLDEDSFLDSRVRRNSWQRVGMIEPGAKLAERLAAAGRRSEGDRALNVSRASLTAVRAAGLNHDYFAGVVERAGKVVAGDGKPRFVLNHVRQIENARRLGVIDEKRYQANLARVQGKEAARLAKRDEQVTLLGKVSFARLPCDTGLHEGPDSPGLVPQPGYYEVRADELSLEQQRDYLKAYGGGGALDIVQKYAFVRLSSLLRSAIQFKPEDSYVKLAAEARAMAELEPRSEWYAVRIAALIELIGALPPGERDGYLAELRELLEPSNELSGFIVITMPGAREMTPSFFDAAVEAAGAYEASLR